ncbi:MAG: tetratricopeptide repeat protein [Paludibacter sp.]|nr:tetratricopeptide repeat protein [Paludibacter sp.]
MMKRSIFIFTVIFSFVAATLNAQTDVAKQANALYSKGDYQAAAKAYEEILKTNGVAAELYYNLGNAYYKQNETAKAILNYERALRLKPGYDDAKVNLEMAQLKVIDNVVSPPSFFIKRWMELLVKDLTSNQWLVVSVITFVLSLTLVLIFVFAFSVSFRKISFYGAVVLFGLCIVTMLFSGIRKNQMIHHNDAIIMSGVVIVKSSPDKSGTDLFQLHEGTKVKVKSTLGTWSEILLGNGNVGWVEDSTIEKI